MHIIFYEDESTSINLHPLNYFRSNIELRIGGYSLLEKWQYYLSIDHFYILTRKYLQAYTDEVYKQDKSKFIDSECLWINSQVLPNPDLTKEIEDLDFNRAIFSSGKPVAFKTKRTAMEAGFPINETEQAEKINIDAKWIDFPWDMVEYNGEEIQADLNIFLNFEQNLSEKFSGIELINKKHIYVSKNARINPMVFLNAENGPIIIEKNVEILPFSFIEGPVFISQNARIKSHTRLLGGSTIGPHCKVAGEISKTIFHSYANKQHEGFLGNSYISPWVNLGADTNNSNLKNNYLNVKVPVNGREIDTGLLFAGLFAGDHAKSAINTMFNTGTILGCFANVYGADFPSKFIPNFAWGNKSPFMTYHLNKAIKTARTVKARRQMGISKNEETVIRKVFEMTAKQQVKDV